MGSAQAGKTESNLVPGKPLPMSNPVRVRADDDPKVEPTQCFTFRTPVCPGAWHPQPPPIPQCAVP